MQIRESYELPSVTARPPLAAGAVFVALVIALAVAMFGRVILGLFCGVV